MTKQNQDKTETKAESHASEAQGGAVKERVAGVLGGALSRIFERAGLDVRVTSPTTQPVAQAPTPTTTATATATATATPSPALPARDALLTLATAVLAERLLSARSPTTPAPAAACDRIGDLLGPAVVDPTARPVPRATAPAVVPPAATRPRAAAAESASAAPAAPASPAAPAPEKRRGFTLRY